MAGVTEQHRAKAFDGRFSSDGAQDLLLGAFLFCCIAIATARARQPAGDWSWFVAAADQLGTDRWLRIYVDNPNAQTGPLTILLAWMLDPLGIFAVRLAIMLLCVAILGVLLVDTRGLANVRWRLAIGGLVFTLWWPQLSFFGHLDDAVVLLLAVLCVAMVRRDRRFAVAVLAGLAVAVKPTAVFMLAFTVPRGEWRSVRHWTPLLVGSAVAAVVWAPFVLGDTGTLDALRPRMPFQVDSVPALVGLEGSVAPGLFRVAQLALVLAAAVYVFRRHGPSGVLWVGTAMRLLTDPAAWPYYTAGFVLGALVWEAYETADRVPWATLGSAVLLAPRWLLTSATARAVLRVVACLGAPAVVLSADARAARSVRHDPDGGQVAGEVARHEVPGP